MVSRMVLRYGLVISNGLSSKHKAPTIPHMRLISQDSGLRNDLCRAGHPLVPALMRGDRAFPPGAWERGRWLSCVALFDASNHMPFFLGRSGKAKDGCLG